MAIVHKKLGQINLGVLPAIGTTYNVDASDVTVIPEPTPDESTVFIITLPENVSYIDDTIKIKSNDIDVNGVTAVETSGVLTVTAIKDALNITDSYTMVFGVNQA